MKEHIVVIGGYGHVGQMICRELCELYPGKVFAAGRSLERAELFSRATGGKVMPLQLNINEPVNPDVLDNVKLIIMCLDQTDTNFVRSCFEREILYVDISANVSFLSQVEKLHSEAYDRHTTAVLSIGLAPGMTNLMALHATGLMDQTDAIDISIMLGLGDQHGKAAIEWTIDNLGTQFGVIKDGRMTAVSSFKDGKITDFGIGLGRKKAYRFNFSDQHVLPRTLGVSSVSTRLCFDSTPVTELLAWLRTAGVFHLLRYRPIRNIVVQLFGRIHLGTEMFAVKIDARGKKSQENMLVECFLQGRKEAEITAKVASAVADAVYRSPYPHGVYHIDQLFDLETLCRLMNGMVSIQTRINGQQYP
ncbi:saccharopine dehydrogenase family protein [Paenibacillus wynnii]|uniref:saccharopine dehydrogenase family protein n=1 Tax=Paenibacillus wynnii TaxID=268407 RepID=UPI002793C8F1|nr:saccharopine dehydrogenase NADP-binding domain-containing protein [Paenibacillus wynnii]MDQ0193575.1 saccharopine dehydrogenase-like NADP-dependent oxidoreductase [Paenibacillus wynnii]